MSALLCSPQSPAAADWREAYCPLCVCAQLLLQSLQCSSHQATSAKVWPFQRRAKAVTEAIVERKQADEESEQAEAEAEAEAEGGSLPGVASHDADLCRCYHGACMHAIQLHIALLTAAGYGNVTSALSLTQAGSG